MLSLEDLSAWTNDDIAVQVSKLLSKGMSFQHGFDEESRFWFARFEQLNEDTQEHISIWDDVSPDQRLVLFNAFGWLWAKKQAQPSEGSPWRRRRELTRKAVTQQVSLGNYHVPDPEDLDPKEVDAVYEADHSPQKK